ncbi:MULTISPECIES: YjdF family protein [unclassified Clostridioides]|uniref:YjdF family protein n=1 Tax=unclassified Clostridioides TaxID=2635829 RepID=UPI001D0CC163|nr:YjdF family protein [Clostridioides sp. ES-S-0001-02]MCC0639860.1 YjdF family protein [Clostridioides sp. ES-S-0049-03]MCC0653607.1 YjdF family protein [Clostridioides sp. ES-S-0001-03]MCC0655354.1 YjdF family protein [Clostridioides sp. ES-S-0123-01]MCC0671329.1 YjdF family protein [Clostridioides sp. ES-S-0145-01]MCC0674863.1 YjdF family protein [Clostridioides sp. ES-W-0018-02]MCC0696476.1 YjdF family protein [Clostridioides sp. ES-S-0048-02]MCC0702448.1 YjdF family protein [Clostridio
MDNVSGKLTVLFEEPFWIGIFERQDGKKYEVCRVVFGAEPKDVEVYEFILEKFFSLNFGSIKLDKNVSKDNIGYKRMQRKVKKEQSKETIGTKAQNALKLQHEERKQDKKILAKSRKEEEKERLFTLKQEKRKAKHKGH